MIDQDKPTIGDYVRSADGHHGILTAVKDSPWGPMAFFITADGRYYEWSFVAVPQVYTG